MGIGLLCCASLALAASDLVTGPIEVVGEGFQFTEGPVWLPSGQLAFSDIPADTVYLADRSVLYKPSGNSNGLTLDREGRVVRCEHGNRRVVRIENDGSITVIADSYKGKKLNSPNDVIVRSDGVVLFTDPPYGLGDRKKELDVEGVYAVWPDTGRVKLVTDGLDRPNGIGLSPDEKTLYIADTTKNFVRAFDIGKDASVSRGRVFCRILFPDGLRIDEKGNLWVTGVLPELGGVVGVFSSAGKRLTAIEFPQNPANCEFGGPDMKTLFVTARTAVYKVSTSVAGLRSGR